MENISHIIHLGQAMIDESNKGRTKWRNCRLTNKNPDYQLGWAILADCKKKKKNKKDSDDFDIKIHFESPIFALCALAKLDKAS